MIFSLDELRDYVVQLSFRLDAIQSGNIPEEDIVNSNETLVDYLLNEIEYISKAIEFLSEEQN